MIQQKILGFQREGKTHPTYGFGSYSARVDDGLLVVTHATLYHRYDAESLFFGVDRPAWFWPPA